MLLRAMLVLALTIILILGVASAMFGKLYRVRCALLKLTGRWCNRFRLLTPFAFIVTRGRCILPTILLLKILNVFGKRPTRVSGVRAWGLIVSISLSKLKVLKLAFRLVRLMWKNARIVLELFRLRRLVKVWIVVMKLFG